jgi:integrase
MASIFKSRNARKYTILFKGPDGRRHKRTGFESKQASKDLAAKLEKEAREIREGLVDPKKIAHRDAARQPISSHVTAWLNSLAAENATPKHVRLHSTRVRRLLALAGVTSLSDLSVERIQGALAKLRAEGLSLTTLNHYRTAVKVFVAWCAMTDRLRENCLAGKKLASYNAEADPRHQRRTISLEELQRLIDAAHKGPKVLGVSGPARSVLYRLTVATGLRYSEAASITPEWVNLRDQTVTVQARYTKNGKPETFTVPSDLVNDLRPLVDAAAPGMPVFRLQSGRGAKMLRFDLEMANIPYRDGAGFVFDFHSLRCQTATLADRAGVSPRVVQRLMRHSSLELTDRYTRPRAVDIEAAARSIPSLRPTDDRPESLRATGTDPGRGATNSATVVRRDPTRELTQVHASQEHQGSGPNRKAADVYSADELLLGCRIAARPGTTPTFSRGGGSWFWTDRKRTLYTHTQPPNGRIPDCLLLQMDCPYGMATARSWHLGGVNLLMGDGSTRFVKETIDVQLWRAFGTRNGGELVD